MKILGEILRDDTMLDSRADPTVPYVFCVSSKMSSIPTHVALFRNYNYAGSELGDPFTIDPEKARLDLDLPLELESDLIRKSSYVHKSRPSDSSKEGSRHPGTFHHSQTLHYPTRSKGLFYFIIAIAFMSHLTLINNSFLTQVLSVFYSDMLSELLQRLLLYSNLS